MSDEHEHIVKSFSEDLIQLKNMILKMAGLVENQLQLSLDSILKHDSKDCVKIIKSDNEIDELHINIQNYVERIITLRQPISLDLRNVLAAMQIARELERVGDLAVNIAKRAIIITQHAKIDNLYDLEEYAIITKNVLREALDAYVENDLKMARKVWDKDDLIDDLYAKIFQQLLELMNNDKKIATPATHLSFAIKNIERIGDHATNIAEDISFILTADRNMHMSENKKG